MDNMEFERGNPQEDGPKRVAQRDWRKAGKIGLAVLGVIGVVMLILAIADTAVWDNIRRFGAHLLTEKDENGCVQLYEYSAEKDRSSAMLGDNLVLASARHVMLINDRGENLYSADVKFHRGAIATAGNWAAVYDVGGREIHLLGKEGLVRVLKAEGNILACSVNEKGYLAVTSSKSGYKAAVSVYDQRGELAFQFLSSDRFLMTAAVAPECTQMAAVSMGMNTIPEEDEGTASDFESSVVLYDLKEKDPRASQGFPGEAVVDLGLVGDNYCAVTEEALRFVDQNGTLAGSFEFEGRYLRRCSLGGGDYAALVLGRSRSGARARLVTVDENGERIGQIRIDDEVLSISASGKYVAVLYSDYLTIYDKKLRALASLDDVSAAKSVLMRPDGSAVLVGAEAASLYLP